MRDSSKDKIQHEDIYSKIEESMKIMDMVLEREKEEKALKL